MTTHEKECNEIFVRLQNSTAKSVDLPPLPPPLIFMYLQDKVPTNMEITHCNFALIIGLIKSDPRETAWVY
jgi:hypothetical protein